MADVEVISDHRLRAKIDDILLNGASVKQEALKRLILNPSASLEDLKGAGGDPQLAAHQGRLASKQALSLWQRARRDSSQLHTLARAMEKGDLPDYDELLWLTLDKDRLMALLGPQLED